ncbi:MAG: aspartate ammonia-lyase [Elusimicrobia bacterium]|nr:aspartate ammonia-lyase [Candidatus Obscuribacterium magneticum]
MKGKTKTAARSASVRTEADALGPKSIPLNAYYGVNTVRALENFPISGLRAHPRFVEACLLIKKAAALVNKELRLLDAKRADAIVKACDEILGGKLRDQFVVDVFQMGAGTSFHMNVNEVVANRAIEILGGKKGEYEKIHPNDHVNAGQSTNDVYPTAIRVAARLYLETFFPVAAALAKALLAKGKEFDAVVKAARTHLQDAVPIRLGQEFTAYGRAVEKALEQIRDAAKGLEALGIGGSAAGTGLNTDPDYPAKVVKIIAKETGLPFQCAGDLREAMQSQGPIAHVSSALKNLAVELTRLCNDLRLMASGPATGFAEIHLPPVQAGSSIMPGKTNPSMAEMLNMVSYQVMGNDVAITMAVQAGQLELNVMMPLMAFNLLFSIEILTNALQVFTDRCVKGIGANKDRCRRFAEASVAIATVLNPLLGYAKVAELVKEAVAKEKSILDIVKERKLLPPEKIREVFDVQKLTEPGVHT